MSALYRHREPVAATLSLLVGLGAAWINSLPLRPPPPLPKQTPVTITMAPPVPEAPPPPPVPQQRETPPEPVPQQPVSLPQPQAPKLSNKPSPTPAKPQPPTPAPPGPPVAAAPAPPAPAPTPAPPPRPAPAATPNEEASYVAQIRASIEARKTYPTSKEARMQRPKGQVEVWFILDRSGHVQDAGVTRSSNSMILDTTALATVKRGEYPPIPAGAFASQPTAKLSVTLEYEI